MKSILFSFSLLLVFGQANSQNTFDVQGHRGCRGLYPENTIMAFIKAAELGVTTLELDVVISQDGEVVVSHDPYLSPEICSGPNGEKITLKNYKKYKLYEMTYKEISKCDCGSKPHKRFPNQINIASNKPTLNEVISRVDFYTKEHNLPQMHFNIETKSNASGDNVLHPTATIFVEKVMDVVLKNKIEDRCNIQSFDERTLQVLHLNYPTIQTSLLVSPLQNVYKHIENLGFMPNIVSPEASLVDEKLIGYCHQYNIKVIPWTVNDEDTMHDLINMGVDGIITDYPNKLIAILKK